MTRSVVVVTGAAQGIGEAIVNRFESNDWNVVAVDLDFSSVGPVRSETRINVDGNVRTDGELIISSAIERFGKVDALVNNAGIIRPVPLAELTGRAWDDVMGTNLEGTLAVSRAALTALESSGGSIVNIASLGALFPRSFGGAYSASKAAVVAITEQMACEWGPRGIRVNAIAPGMIRTPMADRDGAYADPDVVARREAITPLGRVGVPSDVAKVVSFLVSPEAGFITGETIVVDGGWSRVLVDLMPQPE